MLKVMVKREEVREEMKHSFYKSTDKRKNLEQHLLDKLNQ